MAAMVFFEQEKTMANLGLGKNSIIPQKQFSMCEYLKVAIVGDNLIWQLFPTDLTATNFRNFYCFLTILNSFLHFTSTPTSLHYQKSNTFYAHGTRGQWFPQVLTCMLSSIRFHRNMARRQRFDGLVDLFTLD